MSGYLELPDGGLIGVRDGLVIGRVAACDIVVEDGKASRRHARLVVEAGVVEVEDMQSSNGTMLNGKNVTRRMLRDGDVIGIGKSEIVYREGPLPVRGSRSPSGAGSAAPQSTPPSEPSAPATRTNAPASRPVFDDDDDLLGGDAPPPPPKPAAPLAADDDDDLLAPAPVPPPVTDDDLLPPPSSAPATGNVVEFEDEVVEVQTPAPKPPAPRPSSAGRAEPSIEVRKPRPTKDASAKAAAKGQQPAGDVVASSQRILQYSKKAGGGGVLGDDLNQMSGGTRALLVLVALAAGAGIVWAIATAMQ